MADLPGAAVQAAESAIRDAVRIRLGPNALAQAGQGVPLILSGKEAEQAARAALEAAAPIIAEQARAEEAGRALAEAREEIEEDARVMRAWRRREAQAVARAEEAEAAIARVRDVHHVHRCAVDGHIHTRTPTPCVNDGFCECGRRAPCPTVAALDSPEGTP